MSLILVSLLPVFGVLLIVRIRLPQKVWNIVLDLFQSAVEGGVVKVTY